MLNKIEFIGMEDELSLGSEEHLKMAEFVFSIMERQ